MRTQWVNQRHSSLRRFCSRPIKQTDNETSKQLKDHYHQGQFT